MELCYYDVHLINSAKLVVSSIFIQEPSKGSRLSLRYIQHKYLVHVV